FVFNAGFYNSGDTTGPGAGSNRFVISASNNAGRAGAFPKNPAKSPVAITTTGWYTFVQTFKNDGTGHLEVDFSIVKTSDGSLVPGATWQQKPATVPALGGDVVSGAGTNIGGNRYGWFASNEFSVLYFDNVSKGTNLPAVTTV